jgi:formylglycine-generating enzyme required for sulfatase activity
MPSLLSLQSIDATTESLSLKTGTLKAELVNAIRSRFHDASDLQTIASIATDEIITHLWGPCAGETLKARRKNFSSLKSALNRDLKELDRVGKNPAGIILGRDNIFIVSEERKDDLLNQLGISADAPHLFRTMLATCRQLLQTGQMQESGQDIGALLSELDSLRSTLKEMRKGSAQYIPASGDGQVAGAPPPPKDELQVIELAEDEEIEVLPADQDQNTLPGAQPPPSPTAGSLALLSQYMEVQEALHGEAELLREHGEDLGQQIVARFMPRFVKIPAGLYTIGGKTMAGAMPEQKGKIALAEFYLGQAPITNDLFDLFVRATGYVTDAEQAGFGVVCQGRCTTQTDPVSGRRILSLAQGTTFRSVSGADWRHPDGPASNLTGRHNHPVVQVSHKDARAFAAWAGKRLPSEEEWEAAARGPQGLLFPWGNEWRPDYGNFAASCLGTTTPVDHFAAKAASPFAVWDLLGNVAEWTASPYRPAGDRELPERAYLLKGGSWASEGVVTATLRQMERERTWTNTIGFRCAV